MKQITFVGTTLKNIRDFPETAKRITGFQLRSIQRGDEPDDWKPMTSIGMGVREIRIHVDGEFRVIYVANIGSEIYVLHAFRKKTQKTEKKDIDMAKKRLKEIKNG